MSKIEKLTLLAKQGDVESQYEIGYYYENSDSDELKKAVEYYELAAKQGHCCAQNNLGSIYTKGYYDYDKKEFKTDIKRGFELFEMAPKKKDTLRRKII